MLTLDFFNQFFNQKMERFKKRTPGILMLRHAEKEEKAEKAEKAEKKLLLPLKNDTDIGITMSGEKNCFFLSQQLWMLGLTIDLLKSSPVNRCLETSQALKQGFLCEAEVLVLSHVLGDPGVFVDNASEAEKTFIRYSVEEVVNATISKVKLPGIRDRENATNFLLREIVQDLEQINRLGIYVTHDSILASFVGTLTNTFFSSANWFDYLDGIYITINTEGELILYWKNETYLLGNSNDYKQ